MKYEIPKEWLASKTHLEDGVEVGAGTPKPLTLEAAQVRFIDLLANMLALYHQDDNDLRSERGAEPLWNEDQLTIEGVKRHYWSLLNPDIPSL